MLKIPVVQEEVHVSKRTVETGRGVRIHKTVSEQPQEVAVDLARYEVAVTRVAVDRIVPLAEAPQPRQEGDTYIVPVIEEVLVVEKRLRIKEEIHITRTRHAARHADTVLLKSEHVSVERFDNGADPATSQ